jgi:DNA-binding LytR/AlgR family response regulator
MIEGKTETISKNIGSIESLFSTQTFYKISRSIIINLKYISKINRLKRLVYLNVNNNQIELKASKERLYDLEALVK